MNFFEQELRKIVAPISPDATYVGRAAYVDLGGGNRAKLQFVTQGYADNYSALLIKIINTNDGELDAIGIKFSDVFGKKKVGNPNFQSGIVPHIWTDRGQSDWYVYRPTANDYKALTDAASAYMEVFQQQSQDNTMQQGMMM